MPRNRVRKTTIGLHSEADMRAALQLISEGQTIRAVAKSSKIPFTTLYRYNKKVKLSSSHDPINTESMTPNYSVRKIFNDEQEQELVNYLSKCSKMFYGLKKTLISPFHFRGLPKAKPRKNGTTRRKGKSMIVTDTPNKDEIEQRSLEKNKHMNKTVAAKAVKRTILESKTKTVAAKATKRTILESSSDNDDDQMSIHSEEEPSFDEEQDEVFVVDPKRFQPLKILPKEGNFILVEFEVRAKKIYYIGKVIGNKDVLELSFLRKSAKQENSFHLPNIPDISSVRQTDVKMILPQPRFTGSTKRAQGLYHFDIDCTKIDLRVTLIVFYLF